MALPILHSAPRSDGHSVLREFLRAHGYKAHEWGLGLNLGPRGGVLDACLDIEAENIEVEASHVGLGAHPAVIYAIADRLAEPDGGWKNLIGRVACEVSFTRTHTEIAT